MDEIARRKARSEAMKRKWLDPVYKALQSIRRIQNPQELSPIVKGEDHPSWKGPEASYFAIHIWVRRHWLPKDSKCERCGLVKVLEAHNLSGTYKRVREDWEFLCEECHFKEHGKRAW